MSINETVKSFLLHKHHEFVQKTRIGRAAERIWVKHQFKEKGILNPQNYSQKEMNMFYSVIAANYVHLHEAFPQVFDTARVYDAKILGLEPGKTITNADLYLTRVIEKARTVEFREIAQKGVSGLAFSTGMMVDKSKTENDLLPIVNFFRSHQYLTDPKCPASFATILQDSSTNFGGMLAHILSSKETREAFIADPKGFIDTELAKNPEVQLTDTQQLSYYAMISPTFVEAVKANEEYIESVEATLAEQALQEATSHEAFHLGLIPANEKAQNEPLTTSYEKTDKIADTVISASERSDTSQYAEPVRIFLASNDRAITEIYTDLLASRACGSHSSINTASTQNADTLYFYNAVCTSSYRVNEPIFTLLEHMVNFTDNSTVAVQNFFSGILPTCQAEEREFLPAHPIFDANKTAFNLLDRNGNINIPSQFKDTVKEPELYAKMSPFKTFCALTNNILNARLIANETQTFVNPMPMVEQVQMMLFQSFNQQISNVAENALSVFNGNPTNEEMAALLLDVVGKEEIVQNMFSSLVFERDGSKNSDECKEFITSTYGKDANLATVLQSPKTIEEIQMLIDNGIIMETPLLATYMTTLSNMQSIREVVEASVLSQNPNLDENQLNTLLEISNPSPYAQMTEIEQTVVTDLSLSLGTVSETENLLTSDVEQVAANETLSTDASAVSDGGKVEIATTSSDLSAGGSGLGMDMGSCDIGG